MTDNINGDKSETSIPRDNPELGYTTAIQLVSLVSQEIYSRFAAMLTSNSIIIAFIGLSLTSRNHLLCILGISFSIVGLVLCYLWWVLNDRGVDYQDSYRGKAKQFEKHLPFKILNSQDTKDHNQSFYRTVSRCIILLFVLMYLIVLITTIIFFAFSLK